MRVSVGDARETNAGGWWGILERRTTKQEDQGVEMLDEILDRRREDTIRPGWGFEKTRWWGKKKRHGGQIQNSLVLQHR